MGKAAFGWASAFLFGFFLAQRDLAGINSRADCRNKGRLSLLAIGFSDLSSFLDLFADLFAHPLREIGEDMIDRRLIRAACGGCMGQCCRKIAPFDGAQDL